MVRDIAYSYLEAFTLQPNLLDDIPSATYCDHSVIDYVFSEKADGQWC